eukprot:6147225-Pyramimonas_sp.AAC.1
MGQEGSKRPSREAHGGQIRYVIFLTFLKEFEIYRLLGCPTAPDGPRGCQDSSKGALEAPKSRPKTNTRSPK